MPEQRLLGAESLPAARDRAADGVLVGLVVSVQAVTPTELGLTYVARDGRLTPAAAVSLAVSAEIGLLDERHAALITFVGTICGRGVCLLVSPQRVLPLE